MLRGGVRRSAVVPTSNPPRSVSKLNGFIEMINDRARRVGDLLVTQENQKHNQLNQSDLYSGANMSARCPGSSRRTPAERNAAKATASSAMLASLSQALASATEVPGQRMSHLARARLVAESRPVQNGSTENAEFEGAEWWEEHAELFAAARAEWGVLHPELFDLEASAEAFIDPRLLRAVSALERAAAVGGVVDESELRSLFTPAAKGVWRFPLFTPLFCEKILAELRHAEASGVPLRRPNGMNRFGAILEDVPGGVSFEESLRYLTRRHLRPLSQMLFPWLVAAGDADEHYGFVVRYKVGEDVSLAQVRDKATATPSPCRALTLTLSSSP